jgi:hypothetical protein
LDCARGLDFLLLIRHDGDFLTVGQRGELALDELIVAVKIMPDAVDVLLQYHQPSFAARAYLNRRAPGLTVSDQECGHERLIFRS